MNGTAKILTIFSFFLLLFSITASAQLDTNRQERGDSTTMKTTYPPEPDEKFDVFLLVLGTIFLCGILSAGLVGAFAAALFLLILGGLFLMGLLSTAFLIGWYQRSFSAGYKSFLLIGCALLFGVAGMPLFYLLQQWLPQSLGTEGLLLAGFTGGALGGLVLGYALYRFSRTAISYLIRKNSARFNR